MKLISIILPVYNSEEFLTKCIDSIIKQSYHNWELIVINDGSTDGSKNIINRYSEIDSRIKVFHFANRGVASSRNSGIEFSKGEYITFIDSDDFVEPNYLEKLVYGLENNNCDISSCDVLEIYNDNSRIIKSLNTIKEKEIIVNSKRILNDLLYHKIKNGYSCAKLYKKSVIKQLFQNYSYCEDVLFLVNNLSTGDYLINVVHEPLYVYIRNDNSVTMRKNPQKIKDMLRVSERIIDESKTNTNIRKMAAQALLIDYSFYIFLYSKQNPELKSLSDICKSNIQKNRISVLFDINSSLRTKGACVLSFFPDGLITFIYNHQSNKSL